MKKNIENKGLENLPKYGPKDTLWDNIEKGLDKDKKRRFGWYTLSGIAASLLLVFIVVQSTQNNTDMEPSGGVALSIGNPNAQLSEPEPQTITETDISELRYQDRTLAMENNVQEPISAPPEIEMVEDREEDLGVKFRGSNGNTAVGEPITSTFYFNNATADFSPESNTMATMPTPSYQWSVPDNASGTVIVRAAKPLIEKDRNVLPLIKTEIGTFDAALGNSQISNNLVEIKGKSNKILNTIQVESGRSEVGLISDGDADGTDDYYYIDISQLEESGNQVYQCTITDSVVIGGLFMPTSDYNQETYVEQIENEFQSPFKDPLSTFAIDVDNASYAIMRTKLASNQRVPKNSVRIEEYINYFSYDYQAPKKNPFSVNTEMAQCPWNTKRQLLHIGLQGKKIDYENTEASNLVFLLDVSGSMSDENKLPLVKKSMNMLVEQMGSKDRISIVTYAGAAGLALESTSCDRKEYIAKKIKNLESGGSTAGGEGIKLAYKLALENLIKEGNNRIILCTDGDFNVGESSDGAMEDLIVSYRDKGVFITVCGFGMGNYQDSKMETIADNGNGNYFYIDNFREADKVFNRELRATLFTIAKDVKIQVEFNPAYVKAYRLIGYENRIMPAQDFNDDTKDGGELGAGHTVTALYEIIPASSDENFDEVDPLKYQKVESKENLVYNNEAVTVKLRYKEPKGTVSKLLTFTAKPSSQDYNQASEDFRFSAGVALYASTLRQSKFTDDIRFTQALELVKGASFKDLNEDKAQLIKLMEKARTVYGSFSER
jgi:Ca-activated chloride channel family protein